MKKIIELIKVVFMIIIVTSVSLCGFGGGMFVFGLPIVWLCNLQGVAAEIVIVLSIFVPMPFAFWLAPKISDKIF